MLNYLPGVSLDSINFNRIQSIGKLIWPRIVCCWNGNWKQLYLTMQCGDNQWKQLLVFYEYEENVTKLRKFVNDVRSFN